MLNILYLLYKVPRYPYRVDGRKHGKHWNAFQLQVQGLYALLISTRKKEYSLPPYIVSYCLCPCARLSLSLSLSVSMSLCLSLSISICLSLSLSISLSLCLTLCLTACLTSYNHSNKPTPPFSVSSFGMGGVSHPSQLYAVKLLELNRVKQVKKPLINTSKT